MSEFGVASQVTYVTITVESYGSKAKLLHCQTINTTHVDPKTFQLSMFLSKWHSMVAKF